MELFHHRMVCYSHALHKLALWVSLAAKLWLVINRSQLPLCCGQRQVAAFKML